MKTMTLATALTAILLTGCATTNPGNIGAGMYEDMLTQRAALAGGSSAAATLGGEAGAAAAAAVRTCDEIDTEITAIYTKMQPEEAGLAKRALSTGQGIGETIALQQVTNAVPGAGMVNNLFKMRSGKKKAEAMFQSQLSPTSRLAELQKERMAASCPGSMLELFEERE